MATLKTRRGLYHYKPVTIYLGITQINKEVAFQNLKDVAQVLKKHNIPLTPCFGTLLGIVRDNDFIDWDEDIDLMILSEDREDLLDAFWDLREIGFEVIREDRCNHLYSIMKNGEYIDFYVMDKVSPELRTNYGGGLYFENHLTNLINYNFKGLNIMIPKDYEEYLSFVYGDWKTPVKYIPEDLSEVIKTKRRILQKIKGMIPSKLKFWMLKKYHKKDVDRFQQKCKLKNITLKYPINW